MKILNYKYLKLFLAWFLWFNSYVVFAQDINYIKNSGRYYWGQGWNNNERVADKEAIDHFINEITRHIKDKFLQVSKGQEQSLDDFTKSVLKTYANASFQGMNVRSERDPSSILTIRYIEKENLNSLFQKRKNKITDYFNDGLKAESENRLADALQKYYWSFLLLQTHPDNQTISIEKDGMNVPLINYLPSKINQIFYELKFEPRELKPDKENGSCLLTLNIIFQDKPVENLYYKYWKDNSWSELTGCKNGIGVIELTGINQRMNDSIQIQVEYNFESEARIDKELFEIFSNLRIPVFQSSLYNIINPNNNLLNDKSEVKIKQELNTINIDTVGNISAKIDSLIYVVVNSIDNRNSHSVKNLFTDQGWQDFNYMTNYGNAKLVSHDLHLDVIKVNNDFVIRKVPVFFRFKTNKRVFVEDLVFYMNEELKITGLSFSLSDVAINDILSKKTEWGTIQDKYQLIQFMENYKTAYCFKNLDYIEKIFHDDALIIVGRSLVNAPTLKDREVVQLFTNDQVEYIQKSKSEYLRSLELVFRSNEFVNIHFEDNSIKRRANSDDKIFGIQIAQYYTSTSYSDKGYLFLMLDLNDSLNPLIHVRTWQPNKNPDGSIIGLQDFRF